MCRWLLLAVLAAGAFAATYGLVRLADHRSPPSGMVWIPGGTFLMGSNAFYREERPVRPETTDGFWIDQHPVTNAQFGRFVEATRYVTFSERVPTRDMYPDAAEEFLVPGSLVFVKPPRPVSLRDHRAGLRYLLVEFGGVDLRH